MRIIEELWYGAVTPGQRKSTEAEKDLLSLIQKNHEKLSSLLSDEAKDTFDKLIDCQKELSALSNCEIFIKGFRMGARIMLETMEGADFRAAEE